MPPSLAPSSFRIAPIGVDALTDEQRSPMPGWETSHLPLGVLLEDEETMKTFTRPATTRVRKGDDMTANESANVCGQATRRRTGSARRTATAIACLAVACAGMASTPPAIAEAPQFHVRTSQDLCNSIWPTSLAMPRPDEFGTICVRKGGVLERLAKSMPSFVSDTFTLEPGSAVELPIGSVRVNPVDPMSDWIIPD